jgi:lysozyme
VVPQALEEEMSLRHELTRQLRVQEGVRKCAYQDHLGFWTIGVGRLVDSRKPGAGLRDSEIDLMLLNDIEDRIGELTKRIPWIAQLNEARQGVLLNMSFQLGVEGLLGFKTTLRLTQEGQYFQAAKQMLDSKWAQQTPNRAKAMARQRETGEWQ